MDVWNARRHESTERSNPLLSPLLTSIRRTAARNRGSVQPLEKRFDVGPDLIVQHLNRLRPIEPENAMWMGVGQPGIGRSYPLVEAPLRCFHTIYFIRLPPARRATLPARLCLLRRQLNEVRAVGNEAVGDAAVKVLQPVEVMQLTPRTLICGRGIVKPVADDDAPLLQGRLDALSAKLGTRRREKKKLGKGIDTEIRLQEQRTHLFGKLRATGLTYQERLASFCPQVLNQKLSLRAFSASIDAFKG